VFFVWVSVFNLFVVSVFWSFMADIFSNDQAKRLFGVVAAGGSAGAIAGPLLTAVSVEALGIPNLLLVSAGLLLATVVCIQQLAQWAKRHGVKQEQAGVAMGGEVWDGLRLTFSSSYLLTIAWYILMLTLLATFLYLQQQDIVARVIPNSNERTQLFARIDLAVNVLTLLIEIFLTGRLVGGLGVGKLLMLLPLLNLIGYCALAFSPTLAVLIVFQALRRAVEYAIARPVREILFTVVGRLQKYKAKNFIDTVVSRGGDALGGWFTDTLRALGAGIFHIAAFAIPFAMIAAFMGYALGRRQEMLREQNERAAKP
jgi:ATP:ADP antiporter, AAA family